LSNKRGFSYIEVIFAVMATAAIFSAVLPLLFATVNSNRDTKLRLIAYESASNEIEKLREAKIPTLVASDTTFTVPEIPGSTGHIIIERNLNDNKIAKVKVTVDWFFNRRNQRAELNTYLYGSTE
jgi:type II secretory pathway pseudopilin PulG